MSLSNLLVIIDSCVVLQSIRTALRYAPRSWKSGQTTWRCRGCIEVVIFNLKTLFVSHLPFWLVLSRVQREYGNCTILYSFISAGCRVWARPLPESSPFSPPSFSPVYRTPCPRSEKPPGPHSGTSYLCSLWKRYGTKSDVLVLG